VPFLPPGRIRIIIRGIPTRFSSGSRWAALVVYPPAKSNIFLNVKDSGNLKNALIREGKYCINLNLSGKRPFHFLVRT